MMAHEPCMNCGWNAGNLRRCPICDHCPGCGGTLASRYHEVAHKPDVETASREDLEAAEKIYDRLMSHPNDGEEG
jgi:hypothetical protein